MPLLLWIAYMKFTLLTLPFLAKMHILSILFLATRRDPRKFPAFTAVAVLAFPSSYLKLPNVNYAEWIKMLPGTQSLVRKISCANLAVVYISGTWLRTSQCSFVVTITFPRTALASRYISPYKEIAKSKPAVQSRIRNSSSQRTYCM